MKPVGTGLCSDVNEYDRCAVHKFAGGDGLRLGVFPPDAPCRLRHPYRRMHLEFSSAAGNWQQEKKTKPETESGGDEGQSAARSSQLSRALEWVASQAGCGLPGRQERLKYSIVNVHDALNSGLTARLVMRSCTTGSKMLASQVATEGRICWSR
jgi:hypothetical protein